VHKKKTPLCLIFTSLLFEVAKLQVYENNNGHNITAKLKIFTYILTFLCSACAFNTGDDMQQIKGEISCFYEQI